MVRVWLMVAPGPLELDIVMLLPGTADQENVVPARLLGLEMV